MPSVIARASGARSFWPSEVVTSRIAAAFSTHGTERSMPPIKMTKVWPAATRPTNIATTRTDLMLAALPKPGRTASPIRNSATAAQ